MQVGISAATSPQIDEPNGHRASLPHKTLPRKYTEKYVISDHERDFPGQEICPMFQYLAGCTAPPESNAQLEKAHINNQIAMNYPLTTSYPVNGPKAAFGESYPVTSTYRASANIHKPTTACGPLPCEPSIQPPNRPSTGRPQHKVHSLNRTISRPAIHLPPNRPACVPSRRNPVKTTL